MAEMNGYAKIIRSYEISIWTLQDRFLSVLKWATMDHKGQIQDPSITLRDDGTQELSFTIPKYYLVGMDKIPNPMWLHLEDQPLEANMHKLKVIFNKQTEDEQIFEFLVTSVTHDHNKESVELTIKAEGLAFHELGKIGYRISLSQDDYEIDLDNWAADGMKGDKPVQNIQYWNDLIFKDSEGNWKGNWKYEIKMDWSSYSSQRSRRTDTVYEDEYVSSWQLQDGALAPRYTEGFREKQRPIDVSESNLYNITQTIAEQFGVFCRYEYEYDDNYQIKSAVDGEPTRKVIYYNNYYYDTEGHIDLTYPYSSSSITRTVDNSDVTTKMYVHSVEENDEYITIMDVEANKSKEDYLMNFDYLYEIQGITEEQHEEIAKYEADMFTFNTELSRIQERIRILTNQLVDVSAQVTTYTNALSSDTERIKDADRAKREITGGSEDIPLQTALTVIEDTEHNWGNYANTNRWVGLKRESILLYENSNYISGEKAFSNPITSFDTQEDEFGSVIRITNIIRTVDTSNSQVFLEGIYNPITQYDKIKGIWENRKLLDEQRLEVSSNREADINWYLHGSRVGYALVGGVRLDDLYYPVGIVSGDVPWTADKSRSDRVSEMRILNNQDEAAKWYEDTNVDPFYDLDQENMSPDLYYRQEDYLKRKAARFNSFEKMMGPAMREGYWQPDDYHDYGDVYNDTGTFYTVGSNKFFDELQCTTPYMKLIWDCDNYYENENPLLFNVGVEEKPNQHLMIDITNCIDIVKEHLDDLCFIYTSKECVDTIRLIHKKMNELEGKMVDFDSQEIFSKMEMLDPIHDKETVKDENDQDVQQTISGFQPLVDNINEPTALSDDATDEQKAEYETKYAFYVLAEEYSHQYSLYSNYLLVLENIETTTITIDDILTLIERNKNEIASWENRISLERKNARKEYANRITYCNKVLDKLSEIEEILNQLYIDKNELINRYPIWLETVENNLYSSYQINSQCELGWVRKSEPIYKEVDNYGNVSNWQITGFSNEIEYIPVLIITGASELTDDMIKYLTTGVYQAQELNVTNEVYEYKDYLAPEKYHPFLGLYHTEVDEEANVSTEIINLFDIHWLSYENNATIYNIKNPIFLGDCRNFEKHDYDGNNKERWIEPDEYEYRRIYPRIFFETIKLKNNSNDLKINVGNKQLTNYEDYYTVSDDRSKGLKTLGVGYYTTIKPHVFFGRSSNIIELKVLYTLSNADVSIYLDALKVMRENAYPKVSYDVELSVLNPNFIRTAYNRLNQIVHINDNDLALDDVSGYISEVTLNLDKPWEDKAEVKNYETKFEDLFSTIVAQTEAMKKSSAGLDSALQAFSSTGLIDEDVLQNSIFNANLNMSFNSGKLTISQENGIWGIEEDAYGNSKGVVAFRGGGIFTSNTKDSDGNWIWNTGILPSGINASLITSGQLDTNRIKIYAGEDVKFQLNAEGLFAYKNFTIEDSKMAAAIEAANFTPPENGIDSLQYVVHNSEGLFLTAKKGTWYYSSANEEYCQTEDKIDRVEVSWKGLILRDWEGREVFYADPDTGNLTLDGIIQARGGTIAGWTIKDTGLFSNNINLISKNVQDGTQDTSSGIYLTASDITPKRLVIEGVAYYEYTYKINNEEKICYCDDGERLTFNTSSEDNLFYINQDANVAANPEYTVTELNEEGQEIVYIGELNETEVEKLSYINEATGEIQYIEYNGATLIENINNNPNWAGPPDWYTTLQTQFPESYKTYVGYTKGILITEANDIKTGILLTRSNFNATFSIKANDGFTVINNGQLGNLIITEDGSLSGIDAGDNNYYGAIENVQLNNNNYIMVNNTKVYLGQCFYDCKYDSTKGIITLKNLNGDVVSIEIGKVSSSDSGDSGGGGDSGNTCESNCTGTCTTACTGSCTSTCAAGCSSCSTACGSSCNKGCASGCAYECGQKCASSCYSKCTNSTQSSGGCFAAGSLITLIHDQTVPIEQLRINDKVLAYNEESHEFVSTIITAVQKLQRDNLVDIHLSDGTMVTVTPSHPLLTSRGWASLDPNTALKEHFIKTKMLSEGDVLISNNKDKIIIEKIEDSHISDMANVYNLTTEKYHTFIVDGIVAHNAVIK